MGDGKRDGGENRKGTREGKEIKEMCGERRERCTERQYKLSNASLDMPATSSLMLPSII